MPDFDLRIDFDCIDRCRSCNYLDRCRNANCRIAQHYRLVGGIHETRRNEGVPSLSTTRDRYLCLRLPVCLIVVPVSLSIYLTVGRSVGRCRSTPLMYIVAIPRICRALCAMNLGPTRTRAQTSKRRVAFVQAKLFEAAGEHFAIHKEADANTLYLRLYY